MAPLKFSVVVFPRTAGTKDHDELSDVDGERDAVHGAHERLLDTVGLAQVVDLDRWGHAHRSTPS